MASHTAQMILDSRRQLLQHIGREVHRLLTEYPSARSIFRTHARTFRQLHDRWRALHARYEAGEDKPTPPCPAGGQLEDRLCWYYVTAAVIHDGQGMTDTPLVGDILGLRRRSSAFEHIALLIEQDEPA